MLDTQILKLHLIVENGLIFLRLHGHDTSEISVHAHPFEDNLRIADNEGAYDWRVNTNGSLYCESMGAPSRPLESLALHVNSLINANYALPRFSI